MKNIRRFIFLLTLIFVIIFSNGLGKQQSEVSGEIIRENPIVTINNPKEPHFGFIKFKLEKDKISNRFNNENFIFDEIDDIDVDKAGNIYILESAEQRIIKFDKKGNYIQTIKKAKQDSQDSAIFRKFYLDDNSGYSYILNSQGKISEFDDKGNYSRDLEFEGEVDDMLIVKNNILWGVVEGLQEKRFYQSLCKIDLAGKILNKYFQCHNTKSIVNDMEGQGVVSSSDDYRLVASEIGENRIVFGYSKEYEINIFDIKDEVVLKIKKESEYKKLSERAKRKRKMLGLYVPEHIPYFFKIYTDSEERIYVLTDGGGGKFREKEYDIFGYNGHYLYKTTLTSPIYAIKNGYFYSCIEDKDTGGEKIIIYKIKNWDQIKTKLNK